VVGQAGQKSGALITARMALEIGVPVGSVPGPAGEIRHRGSNQLLKQGARLVESVSDVLDLMESQDAPKQLNLAKMTPKRKIQHLPLIMDLSTTERKILDILGSKPIHIDQIIACTGIVSGEINAALVSLEIEGLIEDEGGKNFIRVGRE
jgi:DNA processing protein